MERVIQETSEDYVLVNKTTGDIEELNIKRTIDTDDFLLFFLKAFLPKAMKIKGNQLKILLCCWQMSTFNPKGEIDGNVFQNDLDFKEFVRKSGGELSNGAIDVYVSDLAKMGFLIKKQRGKYMINPEYCFKGTITDNTRLRLELDNNTKIGN